MRWCALVALCACNRILGLGEVADRHVDARQYDAPPLNPPRCPPVGAGVPVFGDDVHQVLGVSKCYGFIRAMDGSAMGDCDLGYFNYVYEVARPGEALMPMTYVVDPAYIILQARLGLAGGFAAFETRYSDADTTIYRVVTARYDASTNTWRQEDVLPVAPTASLVLLTPTAGPQPHVAYLDFDAGGTLMFYELAYDGATWTEQAPYPLAPLGITAPDGTAAMTSDGLHVVASGQDQGLTKKQFSDRANITDPFGPFRVLDTVPVEASDLFITDDCGELHFSALDRALYLEHE